MGTCLFAKPLFSNGYCSIFAYFAVVAQQRVYLPQYFQMYYLLFTKFFGFCIQNIATRYPQGLLLSKLFNT
jgi:hypothetical protein